MLMPDFLVLLDFVLDRLSDPTPDMALWSGIVTALVATLLRADVKLTAFVLATAAFGAAALEARDMYREADDAVAAPAPVVTVPPATSSAPPRAPPSAALAPAPAGGATSARVAFADGTTAPNPYRVDDPASDTTDAPGLWGAADASAAARPYELVRHGTPGANGPPRRTRASQRRLFEAMRNDLFGR